MDGERCAGGRVSVVVPTRDRPAALARCLAALAGQAEPLELIVVDDGSSGEALAAIERLVAEAGARLLRGPGTGPAAARNAGARAATGDVVLFLDDDCAPEDGWARALAAACPPGGAAAGETVNADPGDPLAAASQLLTSELQRRSRRGDGTLGFAPTSNLAADRELALRLPFDESFPAAAGEDRDWCARAAATGAAPRYEPRARVRHRQELGGLRGFWRQQARYGRGAARYARATAARGEARALAGPGLRLRLVAAGLRRGARVGALVVLAQVAVAWGYARERVGGSAPG